MDRRRALTAVGAPFLPVATGARAQGATLRELSVIFRVAVDRLLEVPADELLRYQSLAEAELSRAQIQVASGQYMLVVDRCAWVQAALLFWRSSDGAYGFVGASPVSTGRPGAFDHFETPAGVFDHTPANPDFRAEGTYNSRRIRGYGVKGLRVYDFGWQWAPKGWGDGVVTTMRLQMHATDPDSLEPRLGTAQSKGCIRIAAAFNRFLDHFGVLDAEYERLANAGKKSAVLRDDRETVAEPGRYLIVVDSGRSQRPEWSPAPRTSGAARRRVLV